ncbi:MAG: cytochrome c3 family protein [Elusimicrobia bacterium]|nr:cytochrome c3 family protein [Elusimicrobiota bacterium]
MNRTTLAFLLSSLCLSLARPAAPAALDELSELAGRLGVPDAPEAGSWRGLIAALQQGKPTTDLFLERHAAEAARFQAMAAVHLPVKRGWCSICHASAEDPSALRAEGNDICLPCHKVSAEPVRKAHLGIGVFSGSCLTCHDPHASAKPKVLREKGLHMPFEGGMCDMCHLPVGADGKPKVKDPLSSACQECHSEAAEWLKKRVVHGAFAMGDCTPCHNPHASPRPKFLNSAPQEFCRSCHGIPDRGHPVKRHLSFKSGTVKQGSLPASFDCVSCHVPHGGDWPKLRKAPAKELCLNCHKM